MQIVETLLRGLGLVAVPVRDWRERERRLMEGDSERRDLALEIEAAREALAESEHRSGEIAQAVRDLRILWEDRAASLTERLSSAESARTAADARVERAEAGLQACVRERDILSLSIGRSDARVKALVRRRDRLIAERDGVHRQLAETDISGRIRELETENRRLAIRAADLERYLAETRGEGARAYL